MNRKILAIIGFAAMSSPAAVHAQQPSSARQQAPVQQPQIEAVPAVPAPVPGQQPLPTGTDQQQLDPNAPLEIGHLVNLRDPFSKAILNQGKVAAQLTIPELERFELDKFKVVGIITGAKKNKAMVVSPEGKMTVVSEGMKIGNRKGVIKKITPKSIVVIERMFNILGQEEVNEAEIGFAKKDKE